MNNINSAETLQKGLAPSCPPFGKPAGGEGFLSTREAGAVRASDAGACGTSVGKEASTGCDPLGNCHLTSRQYDGWGNMALCSQIHHHWQVRSVCASWSFQGADWGCDRFAGDAAVGKSSLLIRLTDQRFLANPDPTVSTNVPLSGGALLSFLMNCGWT